MHICSQSQPLCGDPLDQDFLSPAWVILKFNKTKFAAKWANPTFHVLVVRGLVVYVLETQWQLSWTFMINEWWVQNNLTCHRTVNSTPFSLRQSRTNVLKTNERHKDNSVQAKKMESNVCSSRIQLRRKASWRDGERERERQRNRETDRQRQRQRERECWERDRQTDRQTDRQWETVRDSER